jgi:hypothetical protein
MLSPGHRYSSYLLRLWWTDDAHGRGCRVALESAQAGERWAFADLDALLAFLKAEAYGPELPHGETHE